MIFFELAGYRERIRHLSEQLLAVRDQGQRQILKDALRAEIKVARARRQTSTTPPHPVSYSKAIHPTTVS